MATKLPWLDEGETYPPPGRVRLTLAETEQHLVASSRFSTSTSRRDVWAGLMGYLGEFITLEERYEHVLGDLELIRFLWLGGSFVSAKLEPRNLDLCVALDATAKEKLFGKPGSAWLSKAFQRDSVLRTYRLSALAVPYSAIESPFRSHRLSHGEINYLRERGAWDDWFQRLRDPSASDGAPTLETAPARRGYVEVVL